MKKLFIIFFVFIVLFSSCSSSSSDTDNFNSLKGQKIKEIAEMSFFQGQKAAMENKWFIKKDESKSIYYWIDNPWKYDNPDYNRLVQEGYNLEVTYQPEIEDK